MMEVRPFATHELTEYARVRKHAGDWSDAEIPAEWGAWIDPGSAWGVFLDGEPISVLRNIPFRQSVRGVVKRMGGIGGVVTLPHHRRQGHAKALMASALEDMRGKGQVVSALYPFKESFYSSFGYVTANANLCVDVPVESLAQFRQARPAAGDQWHLELCRRKDAREAIDRFRDTAILPGANGYVIDPDRTAALWEAHSRNRLVVFVRRAGAAEALAQYWISNGTLHVDELHWCTRDARIRLLAYLAVYQDQIETLRFCNVPLGTNVHAWLANLPGHLPASITQAPMMRVVDPVQTLTGLPAEKPGTVVFELLDQQCEWNNGTYRVAADDGALVAGFTDGPADIVLTIEGLTALVYGIAPLEELVGRGWARVLNQNHCGVLSAWFGARSVFNPYTF